MGHDMPETTDKKSQALDLPPVKTNDQASNGSPIIYFDEVTSFGAYNGIAHITLEALRFMDIDGKLRTDRVAVAHLRMNYVALRALKDIAERLELMAKPVPEGPNN
jgi:hypothetical protein